MIEAIVGREGLEPSILGLEARRERCRFDLGVHLGVPNARRFWIGE